jgi:hypothetical protein
MLAIKLIVMWILISALMFSSIASDLDKKSKWAKPLMAILYFVTIAVAVFWRV